MSLSRLMRSVSGWAVVVACGLLGGNVGRAAPANLLYFPLTNSPGTTFPSSTALGGVNATLTANNGSGVSVNLAGPSGSGVNGTANGASAMSTTNGDTGNATQSANANGAANSAADLGDATLGFGTIHDFMVTFWFKEPIVYSDATGNTLPRLFVISSSGSPGANDDSANTIGVKFQVGNQFEFVVNNAAATTGNSYNAPANTATLGTTLTSDLLPNKWYFVAWVYDNTNLYQFTGSDTSVATLQNQVAAAGLSVNLGTPSSLVVGNRNWKGTRGFFGSMEDFRFYTNVASAGNNASFVESIRKSIAPKIPTISGIYPDGTALLQATNTLVFDAQSSSGFNLTSISLKLNGVDVSSACTYVTNGTGSTNVMVSYTGLSQQSINTAVMSATDSLGLSGSSSVTFDTFNPTNFIVKAEEFDFSGGQYIDNPEYTSYATNDSYFGLQGTDLVDVHKGSATGDSANDYRYDADSPAGIDTQTPLATAELSVPTRFGTNSSIGNHMIGNWSSGEWQNYTKTYPAGNYNVYARLTTSSGSTINLDQVVTGQGTTSQTLSRLGSFTFSGSGAFQWVPLLQNGTLAVVNLAGVKTIRATSGGGANADFYMLVPANPFLPTINNVYPDGNYLFEPTNKLVFTANSASGINTANIMLTVNGTNVSSGLVFSGGPNTWNASYSGLQLNHSYAIAISVTDSNSLSANATLNIDTWNPVFQVEAEDWDFDPSLSPIFDITGFRYIDNPVATAPGVAAANSYEGQVGDAGIDEFGASATGHADYRPGDAIATTPVTDIARRQFTSGALDYNVGFLGAGLWQDYTKTWPTGTFNIYGRMASGANIGTIYASWSQVIAGWGTSKQITRHIGSFAIPTTAGYSAYLYTPLMDRFGNYAQVTMGGTNTFRSTDLTFNQSDVGNGATFGLNINFYMLTAPRTDLPRIDNVYPDGSILMQQTNTLSFVASSLTYGINTTNIQVVLNGVNISASLGFSGSSTSWNVSYPGLQPNTAYSAVITITDNTNQVHATTVNFDTFNPTNYAWEAEDYDFDPALSPVSNGSGLRFIDNPVPTSSTAANSYFGQQGDSGIDYSALFQNIIGTYIYRPFDYVSTEVTSDTPRSKYQAAQLLNVDPTIADYDVNNFTNWIDYTRTFPTGNFQIYARLSAGNGAFSLPCGLVTNGVGTTLQMSNILGNFVGTGASFGTWQYVPLVNTNTGLPVVVSLGGVETLQMNGDDKENANFFFLVPFTGSTALVPTNSPGITGISLVGGAGGGGGGNVVIHGTNGDTGATYYLLTSTNLTTPLSQWQAVATNVVSSSTFTFIGTNAITPNRGQQFYILSGTNN
jgi:hypothetical protein